MKLSKGIATLILIGCSAYAQLGMAADDATCTKMMYTNKTATGEGCTMPFPKCNRGGSCKSVNGGGSVASPKSIWCCVR